MCTHWIGKDRSYFCADRTGKTGQTGRMNRLMRVFAWRKYHIHYENTPMQYTVFFHGCKIENFHMKKCDIYLIFVQNIDCGYTLEPPQ